MKLCSYCGANWDDKHARGECGVAAATERILANYTARRPEGPPESEEVRIHEYYHGDYDGQGKSEHEDTQGGMWAVVIGLTCVVLLFVVIIFLIFLIMGKFN